MRPRADAEALEGLSWAAWWEDDAETVFAARERAFALYRERGDPAGARGWRSGSAPTRTTSTARRPSPPAGSSARGGCSSRCPECPEHGWLAFHEGYLAGDREQALAAAAIGRRLDVCDLEMLGLALEGSLLVADGAVQDGMARLGEATVIAFEDRAQIPISAAWTCCFLVSACLRVYDFERAYAWTDRIADFAERYGSRWMLAFCRAEYGTVLRWRGRWDEAGALLEAAVEDFARSRPAWASGPLAGLAELRRRQGRTDEALALLDRAGPTRAAQLCRAATTGDTALAERLLRQTERPLDRVPILALLARVSPDVGSTAPSSCARSDRHGCGDGSALTGARRPCRGRGAGRPGAARGRGGRVRGRAVRAGAGPAGLGRAARGRGGGARAAARRRDTPRARGRFAAAGADQARARGAGAASRRG